MAPTIITIAQTVEAPGQSLHDAIRQNIEERIMSGEWEPGFRIPYEHEIMEQHGCSRMTVNKALSTLVERGLIERRKRAGSFVASPRIHRAAIDIPDIRTEVLSAGRHHRFTIICREERHANESDCAKLSIKSGRVLSVRCIHYADDIAHAFEDRVINLALVPEARTVFFETDAPGSWLLSHVPWGDARHRISAIPANAETAARLAIAAGHACISIERWTWRLPERITYVQQVYPGEQYTLDAYFRP